MSKAKIDEIETNENNFEILRDGDGATSREIFVERTTKFMPTLPQTFKSLVDCPISIEDKEPRNLIALLGHCLGIDDYETNMAAFWFLDFVALQVLRSEGVLDDNGRSVMVSWLAGEMQLIREKRLSHDEFWIEMENVFDESGKNVSRGRALLHWDMAREKSDAEDANLREKVPEEESTETEVAIPTLARSRVISKSQRKRIPGNEASKRSMKSSDGIVTAKSERNIIKPEIQHGKVLDAVVEATRDMYGDTFHYSLIVAAFLEPVPIHDYTLPFKFRLPRPIKIYDPITSFNTQDSSRNRKDRETSKKTNSKKPTKTLDTKVTGISQELKASTITNEEEELKKKRQYILPLMEANEAPSILENYKKMGTK